MQQFRLVLLAFFLFVSSCKKDGLTKSDCSNLKEGLLAKDKAKVAKAVDDLLTTYSQENLEGFAAKISGRCNVTAKMRCFGCISTLPEQSEMLVSFNLNGTANEYVVDITYERSTKKMKVVGVHE